MRADRGHVMWQQRRGEGKTCEAPLTEATSSGGRRHGIRTSDDCRSVMGKRRSAPTPQSSGAVVYMPASYESQRAFLRFRGVSPC